MCETLSRYFSSAEMRQKIHIFLFLSLDCGSTLTAERGILITPDYPSLHKGPVECQWEIKGLPGEIIALDVQEFDVRNCNASRLEVRDRDNDTLIGSYCGNSKPGRIESHGNQMIVKFTSEGFGEGERFKVEFHRG